MTEASWLVWFNANKERLSIPTADVGTLATMATYADKYCDISDALGLTPVPA